MADISFAYTDLRGQDMDGPYGGLSQGGLGISLATGDRSRFFISAHFGRRSGDPYYDVDGLSDEDGLRLEVIPLRVGVKLNASERKDFRLYLGGAFQYAFFKETMTTGDTSGNPVTLDATGTGTGYYLFVGPEIPVGGETGGVGAEIGYGGTKGDATSGSHSHGVDLTGIQLRFYYTFGL